MLTRDEVSARMEGAGYERLDESIDGHSFWKAPCGLGLFVPEIGPDGLACERTLLERMAEIEMKAKARAN